MSESTNQRLEHPVMPPPENTRDMDDQLAKPRASFDYSKLESEEVRAFVYKRAENIRCTSRRNAQDIVSTGQWLTEVKEKLEHGQWIPWLDVEFGWSDRTARNNMYVFEHFKSENFSNWGMVDISALYLMAQPSTPEAVRRDFIEACRNGQRPTRTLANAILRKYHDKFENPPRALAARIAAVTGEPVPEWWEDHWRHMPPFNQEDVPRRTIPFHFYGDEEVQNLAIQDLAEKTGLKITEKTRYVNYPAAGVEAPEGVR